MKHITGSSKEYVKLKEYLKKLESLAEKFGVDVDDLLNDTRQENTMYTLFRKKIHSLSQRRINILNTMNKNSFRVVNRPQLVLIKDSNDENNILEVDS